MPTSSSEKTSNGPRSSNQPVVQAAVDLDQLAKAGSAAPRLLHALLSLTACCPRAVCDHPLTDRPTRNSNSMDLEQLLVR